MIKKEPMRTCIACREEKPKREMLRIVKTSSGEIMPDLSGKAAGRGAYLCSDPRCAEKLKKNRLLNRTFSCDVPPEIYERVLKELHATE